MSLITVDAVDPPAVIVRVSSPSVSKSLRRVTDTAAMPLALMTALPLNEPLAMSALLMPESV